MAMTDKELESYEEDVEKVLSLACGKGSSTFRWAEDLQKCCEEIRRLRKVREALLEVKR